MGQLAVAVDGHAHHASLAHAESHHELADIRARGVGHPDLSAHPERLRLVELLGVDVLVPVPLVAHLGQPAPPRAILGRGDVGLSNGRVHDVPGAVQVLAAEQREEPPSIPAVLQATRDRRHADLLERGARGHELAPRRGRPARVETGFLEQVLVVEERERRLRVPRGAPHFPHVGIFLPVEIVRELACGDVVAHGNDVSGPRLAQSVDAAPQVLDIGPAMRARRCLEGRIQAVGRLQHRFDLDVGVRLLVEPDRLVHPAQGAVGLLVAPPPDGQRDRAGGAVGLRRSGAEGKGAKHDGSGEAM